MESLEQEVQTETRPPTFWERLEIWTSLPIPEVIRDQMTPRPCDCEVEHEITPTHWNPISGALYYGQDCPTDENPLS